MRFGINTFLYKSPFTNKDVTLFKKFQRWGFHTVEIAIEDPAHVDPLHLKKAAQKAGISIGSICVAMGPGRDFRGSARDQQTSMVYLKALIEQAAAMGCPRIIGPVYSVVGLIGAHDDKTKALHFKLVVKNLKVLAQFAEKHGVDICVEPLNRFETDFLNTAEQGLKLIKAVGSPRVKLHLDTFHMNIEETNQAAAILKTGKYLGHFHACGTDRGIPGGDSLDWKPIVAALKKTGYHGDVVIESFTTDVKVIARAAAIWRKIVPRRDDIPVKGIKNLRHFFGIK